MMEKTSPQDRKLEGENMSSTGFVQFETKEENLYYHGVQDIDPRELATKKDQVLMIDVRQPEEYQGDLGHIPGSRLIALDTLPEHIQEIPKDRSVVFVCRSGGRSARAAAYAMEHGLTEVYNLKGGMILWNELHLQTEA
ncbi:MAG: rhodanese-like domain-containing protein [Pseudobdellovibrionaceae bacterium]